MGKKMEFHIEKDESAVVFLSNAVAGLTRAKADLLIKSGEVRVNGVKRRSNAALTRGDVVTVFVPDDVYVKTELKTVYEDDEIVVFDKPKRVAYDALPELYGAPLFAVHRLDTNTTGLIVFAKTERALGELSSAFKQRNVRKIYETVVYPSPEKDNEVLVAYTKLDHRCNIARVVAYPKDKYRRMITEYFVKERIGDVAVLRVFPHTGRTHQIRAHLCFAGYPIVGEHKYIRKDAERIDGAPDTQMLAAIELEFSDLGNGLEYLNGKCFETQSRFDLGFLRKK
ncbi:MAG: RluA family pseudouridine synthase [Roseburia sp.]|nr:RluA family pseudouridine synthase [Roseburia sp.]